MKKRRANSVFKNSFFSKNWEQDIRHVSVEQCDETEDPLGYKAVFLTGDKIERSRARREAVKSFEIGASFLAQREHNLVKAGYKAPMTHRAIAMIESKLGVRLPIVLA